MKKSLYKKSAQEYKKAKKCLIGGVNSPVRAFGGLEIGPVFIESAKGSKIYDIDGNEYIDYVGSWGPAILGHCHPKVVEAVKKAADNGLSFGAPTIAETELAEKIVSSFDSIDKVRLVSSGTEAVMTAIRLARAYTGRDFIVKMAGCYHGHSDCLLVSAGSGMAELSKPASAGVPKDIAKLTIVIPYNDIKAVRTVLKKYKNQIAAVLVEPVAANMGVVLPEDGFLQGLRDLCDGKRTLLIFDEVITGFRLDLGGAQKLYGIKADITTLGKIVGGGLPLAAVGGRAEIMDLLAPVGGVYQAGTLSGNPIATAAANATIDILLRQKDIYKRLEEKGALLEKGLLEAAKKAKISVTINRAGSLLSCFFTPAACPLGTAGVRNFTDVQSTNIRMFKKFFLEMLNQGIYLAPSAYEAMFISIAHTKQDIEKTVKSAENAFRKIR